jgi:hypothetical protein
MTDLTDRLEGDVVPVRTDEDVLDAARDAVSIRMADDQSHRLRFAQLSSARKRFQR